MSAEAAGEVGDADPYQAVGNTRVQDMIVYADLPPSGRIGPRRTGVSRRHRAGLTQYPIAVPSRPPTATRAALRAAPISPAGTTMMSDNRDAKQARSRVERHPDENIADAGAGSSRQGSRSGAQIRTVLDDAAFRGKPIDNQQAKVLTVPAPPRRCH